MKRRMERWVGRWTGACVWAMCLALLLMGTVAGCTPPQAGEGDLPKGVKPTGEAVRLVIDFDDGFEKHYRLAWKESMTVLDALKAAEARQRGIVVQVRGSGDMAMVTSIDAQANEGGDGEGGNGRNWIYRVNGELADKSCGVYEVRPDDVIMWTFGTYE